MELPLTPLTPLPILPPAAPVATGDAVAGGRPSPWVMRWAALWPRGAQVLDVACGSGRHLRALHGRGLQLTGVDRDAQALASLADLPGVERLQADLEGAAWPWPGRRFDGLVVTHYLWRPLLPVLAASIAPGGVAVMETFARGHEAFGRPRNPDFLLQPHELLDWARGESLQVLGFEQGLEEEDGVPVRAVQRIAARRPAAI